MSVLVVETWVVSPRAHGAQDRSVPPVPSAVSCRSSPRRPKRRTRRCHGVSLEYGTRPCYQESLHRDGISGLLPGVSAPLPQARLSGRGLDVGGEEGAEYGAGRVRRETRSPLPQQLRSQPAGLRHPKTNRPRWRLPRRARISRQARSSVDDLHTLDEEPQSQPDFRDEAQGEPGVADRGVGRQQQGLKEPDQDSDSVKHQKDAQEPGKVSGLVDQTNSNRQSSPRAEAPGKDKKQGEGTR